MATQTGVDLVAKIVDATGAGADQVRRSLDRLAGDAERGGGAAGQGAGARFAGKFASAIASGLAAAGIDRVLESSIDALRTGESIGQSLGRGIVDGLRAIPVAGALGELIPRGLDRLFGGKGLLPGEADPDIEAARERNSDQQERTRRLRERLAESEMTDAERRRKQFEDELNPILRAADPGSRQEVRQGLERLFQDRERRIQQQEAAEERRKREEDRQRQQEQQDRQREQEERRRELEQERQRREEERAAERLQAEQERERERVASLAERRASSLASGEENLAGAVDSRTLGGRAAAFRQGRTEMETLVRQQTLSVQIQTQINENLRLLRETWEQIGVVG